MVKRGIIFIVVTLFTICLFSMNISPKVFAETQENDDEVITQGVYIGSVNVSGMTKEEADKAVQAYYDELKQKNITVDVDGNKESISLENLGFSYADNDYVDEALNIGKTGNLIKRYKELKDTENTNLVYNLEFTLDDEKITNFIKEKCSVYDIEAENATVKRENGEFVYTDEKVGQKVNVDETVSTIKAAILENWNQEDLNLTAVIDEDQPEYTREMVEKCNALLGSYSTTYTTSSEDRAGNLANGAKLINNMVLYPEDVFSAYEMLAPFTTENGYYEAGAYSNGKVIDSIGGGVCQVTTTLYNAVLYSELEVVERYPHSMTISYVDLSRDAAIAGTWKDLKFKNDSESPILIEAYTAGRTITFNIWGNETRDTTNRKVKYETVVLEETAPGEDVVTEDPTKPVTYELTTQSAHIGYVAELYKIVYENGVEVSRTRINKSVYNSSPRYVTVGTKEEETTEEDTKEENTKEESADNSKNNGKKGDQDTTESDSKPSTEQDDNTVSQNTVEEDGNSVETD